MPVQSEEPVKETIIPSEGKVHARHERSKRLNELRKESSRLQQLLKDFETSPEEAKESQDRYERAFHQFVNSHENYMKYEEDAEKRDLMSDNYKNQQDMKLQLDCMVDVWSSNRERFKNPPSVSGLSFTSYKSRGSRSSSRSRSSNRSSVVERRRAVEETRLKVQTLKEKQELERQLESVQQKGTELNRKIELLNVESEHKQAKIDLAIEQIPDEEIDGMNEYFEEIRNEDQPRPALGTSTTPEQPHPTQDEHLSTTERAEIPPVQTRPNSQQTDLVSEQARPRLDQHSPPRHQTPSNQRTELVACPNTGPSSPEARRTPHLDPDPDHSNSTRLNTASSSIQKTVNEPETPNQMDVWNSIARIIKEGPSLPKVELMKFGGDPLEYVEFWTNFKDNIESQVRDESQRFTRLLAQCTGKAREAIRSCVNLDANLRYKEATSVLLDNFGQPHMIVEAHMKKLRELQIRRSDAVALMEFARHLEDSERALKRMGTGYSGRLDNEDIIVMLMKKLPEDGLKRKWADKAGDIIKTKGLVTFNDFVSFVKHIAGRINNRYGRELKLIHEQKRSLVNKQGSDQSRGIYTGATQNKVEDERKAQRLRKCPQCSGPHGIWRCQVFKSAGLDDRLKIVKEHKLCNICLDDGHFARFCRSGFTCRVAGCGERHHFLIHREQDSKRSNEASEDSSNNSEEQASSKKSDDTQRGTADEDQPKLINAHRSASVLDGPTNEPINVNAVRTSRPRVCFKVVPVRVSVPTSQKEFVTYAFLDSGSDATLCLESLVQEFSIENVKPVKYTMTTVNREQEKVGYEVHLNIGSISDGEEFVLENVLTTDSLPVTPKHIAESKELEEWEHLRDLVLPKIEDKQVTILIGNDRPDIIDSCLDRRVGKKGEPCAVKTSLGWTVYGPMGNAHDENVSVSFTRSEYDVFDYKMERMFNAEFDDIKDQEEGMSVEDCVARKMMVETTTLKDGHYQIGLPFKHDPPHLPDSLPTARKRLEYLKSKMLRDPGFHEKYSRVMKRYEEEGAAREVPDHELATFKPLWYLPHHAVWHPRKPEEPRVVFDCASKTEGVSLNDELLRGPENTSTLLGVILRFRVDNVAVTADVKRMFHQVYVTPEHRSALCYLWWPDGDLTKTAKTYQMLVHLFGAKSSPSVAGYALRRTATDNSREYSRETLDAVLRDFYVDDLLKSFSETREAKIVSKELESMLAKAGFQLTKWCSNSREILQEFPVEGRAPTVKNLDLQSEDLPMDRALGVHWNVEKDTIVLVVDDKKEPNNRRGVLSSIATIYDPLGFASPLMLPAREINQELCRLKVDWNSELPRELSMRWKKWKEDLVNLRSYEMPRCLKPKGFGQIEQIELHHFADASQEHGYGTVSYLRFVNEKGEIHVSLVMGKSKVKPLNKAVTVPKLELTAATLATRVNKTIMKELRGRLEINKVMYWTDSMIVLKYIMNETRRFVTFVANRVAAIRQESTPNQWRHVGSEQNPADYASRGIRGFETDKLERWKHGPEFLWQSTENWPAQPIELDDSLDENEEGVKKQKIVVGGTSVKDEFWSDLFMRFSSWEKLRRVVAWLVRIVRRRRFKEQHGTKERLGCATKEIQQLTVSELEEAERMIVRQVQEESFPADLEKTKKGSLAKLKPFREDGLLRIGGRLNRSSLDHDSKHPFILPKDHIVSELITLHYHCLNGHTGSHQTLSKTRERFWITKGTSYVKRILKRCQICKRENAKPGEQVMAPLPAVRTSSDEDGLVYPFAAVGIDYFGPLFVKLGPRTRSKNPALAKRYGCIFTCLRYRAVHIEVSEDLSTDSFISAILRFVGRRGPPRVIYSDNGSNFKGAEVEVIEALKSWNLEKIQGSLSRRGIEWVFNPPGASHQGGVWERLIRSTKKILRSLVGNRELNDESLRTFLVEVEKIMNDRPITPVSSDPRDLEALTPSHILLMRQNLSTSIKNFDKEQSYKARWEQIQSLASTFWERWIHEYLPTLQTTQKWLERKPNFSVGDLVLVVDKDVQRGRWPKGLVEEVFPDTEGTVRRVTVRTANGTYQRDVRKICLLEGNLLGQ